jgi:Tol biopolymer transport system component
VQWTDTPTFAGWDLIDPRISGSGDRIVYLGPSRDLYVLDTGSQETTQLTNTVRSNSEFSGFSISDDGERIAFSINEDLTGGSDHGSSLYRIEADGNDKSRDTSNR